MGPRIKSNGIRTKRVKSIDVVRGIAVVQMVFWQIFDFLVKANIYTDAPYAIKAFNAPLHFSVLVLFLTMSGASLYISLSKRMKKGTMLKKATTKGGIKYGVLKHVVKRYGLLVITSLLFTTFVFDFCTFFRWEEAVQGIALTAIVASLIMLVGLDSILPLIIIGLIALQPLIVGNVWGMTKDYMFCNTNMDSNTASNIDSNANPSQFAISLLLNMSVRGFFSLTNLLPFMLIGVLMGKAATSGLLKSKNRPVFMLGILLVVTSLMLHYYSSLNHFAAVFAINFYARSYSTLLLEIGIVVCLFSLVEYVLNKRPRGMIEKTLNFFVPLGEASLVAYFGHFLLVYKLLQLFGVYSGIQLIGSMPPAASLLISLLLVLFFRQLTVEWLGKRPKVGKLGYLSIVLFLALLTVSYTIPYQPHWPSQPRIEPTYVLITVDVERDIVPFLDSYNGVTEGVPIILDVLREHDVKATFYVTGNVASRYPNVVERIFEEGHEIGGHGFMHEELSALDYDEKYEIIRQTTASLEKYDVRTFRSPYQSADTEVMTILEELGYCAEASYEADGTTRLVSESMVRITSEPLFYPSSSYPSSFIDIFDEALYRGNEVIVVGLHCWEVLEMPEVEGAEEYVVASGDYTYTNLLELLGYLKDRQTNGEKIEFVTAKDVCDLFLS